MGTSLSRLGTKWGQWKPKGTPECAQSQDSVTAGPGSRPLPFFAEWPVVSLPSRAARCRWGHVKMPCHRGGWGPALQGGYR